MFNEVMTTNTQIRDEDGKAGDWIEFYNAGEDSFRLKGLFITDDSTAFARAFTTDSVDSQVFALYDTTIGKGSFYIVWSGYSGSSPKNHFGFHLSKKDGTGEKLFLFDSLKNILDTLRHSAIPSSRVTDKSYGRFPDGGILWKQLTVPTLGVANN